MGKMKKKKSINKREVMEKGDCARKNLRKEQKQGEGEEGPPNLLSPITMSNCRDA